MDTKEIQALQDLQKVLLSINPCDLMKGVMCVSICLLIDWVWWLK